MRCERLQYILGMVADPLFPAVSIPLHLGIQYRSRKAVNQPSLRKRTQTSIFVSGGSKCDSLMSKAMRPRKTVSRHDRKRTNRPGKKQGKTRTAGRKAGRQTLRNHEARMRGFAAINGVRNGKYKSLSAGALAEGTTVQSIKRLLPGALLRSRPGKRLRVRAAATVTLTLSRFWIVQEK